MPKTAVPVLKQPTFDENPEISMQNFVIEVKTILLTNSHNIWEREKVPLSMNCLSYERLWFMQTLNDKEKGKYRTNAGLFEALTERFKLKHSKTILSCTIANWQGEQNENTEEWIGCLKLKVNVCGYKERDGMFKEQFINWTSDKEMVTESESLLQSKKPTKSQVSKYCGEQKE